MHVCVPVCMSVCVYVYPCVCMSVHVCVHIWPPLSPLTCRYPWRSEMQALLRAGVTSSCEQPQLVLEANLGPLEGCLLLPTEPHLQPQSGQFLIG